MGDRALTLPQVQLYDRLGKTAAITTLVGCLVNASNGAIIYARDVTLMTFKFPTKFHKRL